ncbi:MAG: response regulator transcription factor [Patescibacteria group bacterium]
MRILVVDDDPDMIDFLRLSLEAEGYAVDCESDGLKGSYTARTNDYDLAILDYNLPGRNGLDICRDIRAAKRTFPILILSVVGAIDIKVNILTAGADDYLTKPFSFEELLARMRALLRRPTTMEESELTIGDMTIDVRSQKVSRGKKKIYLTKKEFSLLEYLIRNRGGVVSRGMIMEHVWSIDSDPFSNTIEAHILNLRKKLNKGGRKNYIHNVPGRGYKIDEIK